MVTEFNASLTYSYNFAFGGATVDADIVPPLRPGHRPQPHRPGPALQRQPGRQARLRALDPREHRRWRVDGCQRHWQLVVPVQLDRHQRGCRRRVL